VPAAKKTVAPGPAAEAPAGPPEAAGVDVVPAAVADVPESAALPVEEVPRPARLVFVGPVAMVVAGVGAVVPGDVYEVPESVAVDVCRGDVPLFMRVTA
jgi:hypothetical protein